MLRIDNVAFLKYLKIRFLNMVKELGVSKSIIYLKINLIKFLDKYLKLNIPSLSLTFLKVMQRP